MNNMICAMYYTGASGSGLGVIAFVNGVLAGADAAGGLYDGEYNTDEAGRISGKVKMTIPAGVTLVTNGAVSPSPYTVEFPIQLAADFTDGTPMRLELPIGPINIVFKSLRGLPT
jgi:hypothetical protein